MLSFVHYFQEIYTFRMLRPRRLNVEIKDDFVGVGKKLKHCFKLVEKKVIVHIHDNIMILVNY